jgi:hypothetical protein
LPKHPQQRLIAVMQVWRSGGKKWARQKKWLRCSVAALRRCGKKMVGRKKNEVRTYLDNRNYYY